MSKIAQHIFHLLLSVFCFCIGSCKNENKTATPVLFEVLKEDATGLHFNNTLTPTENFNMFNYMYFYNGAGIGTGDFNNDGLADLFFASNQGDNKIYINEGKLHFKDVTAAANIPQDKGWSTGVSIIDINNDGQLDIYICKVGHYLTLKSKNQLLVCKGIKNGIPFYSDEAQQYGLDFSGFSTQAVFFDYDMDGDLDMYLLNHSIHQSSSFAPRKNFSDTYSALSGDRLFRNEGNIFTDVTKQGKINSSEIGYGLGIAVSDINLDGWPDLYIGNDFHENDYLYINQKNGTFTDENNQRLMHTSKFTMGVDIADVNNDGYPEIISTDMLAADPYILKRSLGDDDYDVFFSKIASGYNYQYSRNNLQYNNKNGMFSEAGLYAGIGATDWSWAPLWMDFDNDGLKDLFIANGIPKRLNDMDYINFIYNNEMQQRLQNNDMKDKDMALVNKFPEIKIPNKFYHNNSNMQFADMEAAIKNNAPTYSNGAVYADFDNDGDLDVVVNNTNDAALLYENKAAKKGSKNFVTIKLTGADKNKNAVGAKVILFAGDKIETYEKNPVKGFMSSMEVLLQVGIGTKKIDSAFVVWPDNSFEKITIDTLSQHLSVTYEKGLPLFNYGIITDFNKNTGNQVTNISKQTGLAYLHKENIFNEFDREPLLPHMVSTEGPALAVADINKDGLDDVFIGASKTFHNAVFLQQPDGKFIKTAQPELFKDSMYEDVDATWADINNDGNIDLIIATGGNEYYGKDEHLLPRIYLNDGKANFTKLQNAFNDGYVTASCIAADDFNGDGFIDLFLGGRTVPWNFGEIPQSWLLQNDGTGKFTDVTDKYADGLSNVGMVTNAVWVDIDKDKDNDLIVSCEWGGITAFINTKGNFTKKQLTDKNGWWNFVLPVDADNDGDLDLIAGNLGLNSRLQASKEEPVRLYFNDFDDNGKHEQVLTYYVQHKQITFSNKGELEKQMPILKKKYIYAADFAKASFSDIFSAAKINTSVISTADYFANAILINNGNLNFTTAPLPWQAQLTSYRDASVVDANNDNLPDIFLAGNYYGNNIHNGRYDADYGTVLINMGKGSFKYQNLNGLILKGEARHIRPIKIGNQPAYVVAKNNDSAAVIKFIKK
ncbi:VCBS repeat-containing protein [Ferruginibacter sp.]|nr:VCBS repeat-containing protein [Ferruginibacter sp.]